MRHRLFGLFGLTRTPPPAARTQPPAHPTLERHTRWTSACGTQLTLRRIQAEDAALLGELFEERLSRAARYSRFHGAVGRLSAARLAWMADVDFKHHVAFIVTHWQDGLEHAVAEGRWVRTSVAPGAEFALSVADAWQGHGIGRHLLSALVQAGREKGLPCLSGDVLPDNVAMRSLALAQGFACGLHPEDADLLRAQLRLTPQRFSLSPAVNAWGAFTTAAWQH